MCTIPEILTDYLRYVVVTGDFNINFNLNSTTKQNFMDLINSYGLTQQIFDNTRQAACLDNIFVNFMGVINFKTEVIDAVLSDHRTISISTYRIILVTLMLKQIFINQ